LTLNPSRAGALWVLAFLIAIGAAMRFASLSEQSFHHDEVITVARILPGGFIDMLKSVKEYESNPPLYYTLAWGWTKAFGTGEFGLRSLSACFGLATVPVAYCIGAELSSRRAGLIAAALVAVNPMLIWYSQEARSYAVLVFFCAVSLLFLVRALRTHSGADLSLWALSSGLALSSHYFAFFAVAIEAAWLLVALRSHWRVVLPAVAAVAAVGLALMPLLLAQVNPSHIGWIEKSLLSERFFETGVSFLAGETGHVIAEPPRERYALVPAVLIGLGWLLVAASGSSRERRGALIGATIGLGVTLFSLLAALAGKDYVVERNLLPALLPLGIPAAIGFGSGRASRIGPLLAVVLCLYWVGFGIRVTQVANLQRPDFRAVVDNLGRPPWPRAIVSWKLAAGPVVFYLGSHAHRIYSGETPLREVDVISKPNVGAPTGVPAGFRQIARVRLDRLTLTRDLYARRRDLPFYRLKKIRTGFGKAAVVITWP
jgi:4-amino-4-deoxy-L-arabinose transferase-like glycosyltransferase